MIEFGIAIVILALIGWILNAALDHLAPGHPAVLNHLIWAVVVIIALAKFLALIGLIGLIGGSVKV